MGFGGVAGVEDSGVGFGGVKGVEDSGVGFGGVAGVVGSGSCFTAGAGLGAGFASKKFTGAFSPSILRTNSFVTCL